MSACDADLSFLEAGVRSLLPLLLLCGLASADEPQVWTSRDGRTFTGDFLAARPGKVYVRSKDKKIFAIPMAKLSDPCLAEASYLQEKLSEWARKQAGRKAMDESTATAVLMLAPESIKDKMFLMNAKIRSFDGGTKLKPAKGSTIKFTTEGDVACQADFKDRGEIVINDSGVYCDATAEAAATFSRNATLLLKPNQWVPVQVKVMGGKIVGGLMASEDDFAKAREADGKVREYETEIIHLRLAAFEEQLRKGTSLAAATPLQGEDGKPLSVPEYRFSPEEVEKMKTELDWLRTKLNPNGQLMEKE